MDKQISELHPTILQTQPNVFKDTTGEFPQPLNLEEAQFISGLRLAKEARTQFNRTAVVLVALSILGGAINFNFFSN